MSDESAARARRPRDGGFDFALPGDWWAVPVARAEETERAVTRLVRETVGRRDEDATARAELRSRFLFAADRARAAGATQLHLCREVMPGVPLPATLTVYHPRLTLRRLGPTPAEALRAVLGTIREPEPEPEPEPVVGASADVAPDTDLEFPCGPAVRRVREVAAPADSPEAGITTLEVDYYLATPGDRVLLLSFACGLPTLAPQLTELFDLVVATVSCVPAPARPSATPAS
ncbi:hypothetical protein SCB71_14050 [Herbiconiux sp. KACC 21604]|uniref:hypothetical protein n=1 Tax=unclassified Herbiconiux TaxID=2618217 RepID=UPI0014910EC8|nr:hypothetical protein [Herbiconiux sp. SALV-R1]QJU54267.1 hypothetical protein HL652_11995 [Herbiconiux sp. SALV-R1]WPO85334.1 hypothetical protein SCB71_14050 [Herbiconiux sp. KACC 21604]